MSGKKKNTNENPKYIKVTLSEEEYKKLVAIKEINKIKCDAKVFHFLLDQVNIHMTISYDSAAI